MISNRWLLTENLLFFFIIQSNYLIKLHKKKIIC